MFSDDPNQVNVEVGPRDLVLADPRALHAAYRNQTDEPRDLLLLWHIRPDTVPDHWDRDVPQTIVQRNPDGQYEPSRVPGTYLTP